MGYRRNRGWVAGSCIVFCDNGYYQPLPQYGAQVGIPIVTFTIALYWSNHYSHRPFYRERNYWYARPIPHRPPPPPPHRPWASPAAAPRGPPADRQWPAPDAAAPSAAGGSAAPRDHATGIAPATRGAATAPADPGARPAPSQDQGHGNANDNGRGKPNDHKRNDRGSH